MKWISTKDKLPEHEDYYLCYKRTWKTCVVMKFEKDRNVFFNSARRPPSHWMPLPEPPKLIKE